jgi:hypothetical protein
MNLNSVTSSASAYAGTTAQTSQSQQAKPVGEPEKSPAERVEFREEPPKPVTNALGSKNWFA